MSKPERKNKGKRDRIYMRRWFYILLGGLGMSLAGGSVAGLIWLQPPGQSNAIRMVILEAVLIVGGIGMAIVGFVNGRNAGELDIKKYTVRDHGVGGGEIHFACPACGKGYHASPLLAGKKFTCRDCRQVFEVSQSKGLSGPLERRLLPAPG
jgi:hypothetical protein